MNNPQYLNIGCGSRKLDGFINIDREPGADLQLDVTAGLPFENGSVRGIFCEHFIEHLSQAEGASFLRECRRVLADGGRLRVATPDLDFIVQVYRSENWRTLNPEWARYGYDWIANRAEQINLAMREWGHRWLYNEEELVRLAEIAGLTAQGRCLLGESSDPKFRRLESREGSRLILEFTKERPRAGGAASLVSILIPAYNPRFFRDALESALGQTYRNTEIIVCDDSPADGIKNILAGFSDERIRYARNIPTRGSKGNLLKCFDRSNGTFVKFLNDDDLLHPECVERMLACFNDHPDVTLVTSHRRCIDAHGNPLPDIAATTRPVPADSVIDGAYLAQRMLESRINFIGEPSTVMFRRSDIAGTLPNIISFAGRECIAIADMTMWMNLLSKGDAVYLVDTLSFFRQHDGQGQRSAEFLQKASRALDQIVFDGRRMGLLDGMKFSRPRVRQIGGRRVPDAAAFPGGNTTGEKTSPPLVSIIIPLFNSVAFTRSCLDAIRRNTPAGRYELILVDNASTDGTKEFVASLTDPRVRIITNERNLGFARACNQGARIASGEYLLFLNNDTEPQQHWLEPLADILSRDACVAAAGSRLLYPDGTIQHGGVVIVDDTVSGDPLRAQHNHMNKPGTAPEANIPTCYQALTAACLLVRRTVFDRVGGFDEGYWNGYEDIDLCFRIGRDGGLLVYQPESTAVHHESKSGSERFSRARENIARLHESWLGKIVPDVVLHADGTVTDTGAGNIRPYHAPAAGLPAPDTPAAPLQQPDLVSIVILTWNQLAYTKECVESIRKHTPEPHEIIFVDNGSTDGTAAWLEERTAEQTNCRLIRNGENLGFARGCNQGIAAARGAYILLLNNDVVVTEGWLNGLRECLSSDPSAGIIGPMTNNISGPQKVPHAGYSSMNRLGEYAGKFRKQFRHRRIPSGRVVGFCMLFRRSLVDRIGLFDESFGTGNFEDDDYCLRAALAGFRNMIAGDVFIHHYGSKSFVGNKVDYRQTMKRNRERYTRKWAALSVDSTAGIQALALKALNSSSDAYESGDLQKTVDLLLEGIKFAPADRRLYLSLADRLLESGRHRDALDALSEMPDAADPLAAVLRGHCLEGLERLDDAWSQAQAALAADPRSAPAVNLAGAITYRRGDKPKAKEFFLRAIGLDPGFGEAYTNLGVVLWSEGAREDGLDRLEKGFQLTPCRNDIANAFHAAAVQAGQPERFEKSVEEALVFHPRNRMLIFLYIDILLQQEKYEAAMNHAQHCLVLFGVDDALLAAALAVREKAGPKTIPAGRKKQTLSVCMIVKNEERHLAKCLDSLSQVADELIVVDTGSGDGTVRIAEIFGATVHEREWTHDFSEARNYALEQASGAWLLVMDADEVLSPLDHDRLRALMKGPRGTAYSFITRNYTDRTNIEGWTENDGFYAGEEAGAGWIPSEKVRLFPRSANARFVNPVHELVEPSLQKLGFRIKPAGIPVHHYGKMDSEEDARKKGEEYYLIGRRKLEETGESFAALRELAIQAAEVERYEEAIDLWMRALAIRPDFPSAFFNMGYCYLKLNRFAEGIAASEKALALDPALKEAVLNGASCELRSGNPRKAAALLEEMLRKHPDHPSALSLLGIVYIVAGNPDAGRRCMETIRRMNGDVAEIMARHAKAFLGLGNGEAARALLLAASSWGFTNALTTELFREIDVARVG